MPTFKVKITMTVGRERGLTYPLQKKRTVLGRSLADILLEDAKMSNRHAAIEITDTGVFLVDLGSTNGVFVNDVKIQRRQLMDRDEVAMGMTRFTVAIEEEPDAVEVQPAATPESENSEEGTVSELGFALEVIAGPDKGDEFILQQPSTNLGRGKADVSFRDLDVSRLHAVIEVTSKGVITVKDANSRNGIFVNGRKTPMQRLKVGDEIKLGNTILRLVRKAT